MTNTDLLLTPSYRSQAVRSLSIFKTWVNQKLTNLYIESTSATKTEMLIASLAFKGLPSHFMLDTYEDTLFLNHVII